MRSGETWAEFVALSSGRRKIPGKNARSVKLAVVANFEGDVGDDFEVDGDAGFGGGLEFPLCEGGFGVGVELGFEGASDLNAVDGAVGANDSVKHDFPLDVLLDELRRVLGINFSHGHGHGELGRSGWHSDLA